MRRLLFKFYPKCIISIIWLKKFKSSNFSYNQEDVNTKSTMILPNAKDLVKESISTTAVDSLRESQDFANKYAKKLIIEALERKTLASEFGFVLQTLFQNTFAIDFTRRQVYWSLECDQNYKELVNIINSQIDYLCKDVNGLNLSKSQLAGLTAWWIQNQKILILHSQRNEIVPLLKWTLIQKESVIDPLTSVISEYIPFNQKIVNETVIWALDEYLKSDEAKATVKAGIISLIEEISKK